MWCFIRWYKLYVFFLRDALMARLKTGLKLVPATNEINVGFTIPYTGAMPISLWKLFFHAFVWKLLLISRPSSKFQWVKQQISCSSLVRESHNELSFFLKSQWIVDEQQWGQWQQRLWLSYEDWKSTLQHDSATCVVLLNGKAVWIENRFEREKHPSSGSLELHLPVKAGS